MRVVIAGGHGQIAQHLERRLALRGDVPVGIVRNPDHRPDLEANGAEVAVLDLEEASVADVAAVVEGADAVVFAAGAGPGSGAPRKQTVDRGAAVLLADAAERAGVRRYVTVSAMGAATGGAGGENDVFNAYLDAKKAADDDLMARDLDWTVVRPGRLTNDPGTGRVQIAAHTGRGEVSREDVAAVVIAVLDDPASSGHVFELIGGDTEIPDAVAALNA